MVTLLLFTFLLGAPDTAPLLTLHEALEHAEQHEPLLKAARAGVDASEAQKDGARSGFLPRLDVQGQYQRTTANFVISPAFSRSPIARTFEADNTFDSYNYLTFGATFTQTIFDFGKTLGAYEIAKANLSRVAAQESVVELQIGLTIRALFYNVLKAKELLAVAQANVANQAKHVSQIEQFVAAGTRPKIDLETSRLNLANAQLTFTGTQTQLELYKAQLNSAMGRAPQTPFDVAPPSNGELLEQGLSDESQNATQLMQNNLTSRPEWRVIEAQLRSQEVVKQVAWTTYLPTVFGTVSATGVKTGDFDPGFNGYAGIGLNWNLFNGLQSYNSVAETEAGYQALLAQKQDLERRILGHLTEALLIIQDAKQRLAYTQQAINNARERLALAENRYQAGLGTVIELDDAQIAFSDANAARVQAQYDIAIFRAQLLFGLGRTQLK